MMSRLHLLPFLLATAAIQPSMTLAEEDLALPEESTLVRQREDPLQWTPESVTVIRKADIDRTWRRDLEDLEGMAPGVIIDRLAGTPRGGAISIRGIGSSETAKGFEPAVAVIVDGVYVGTHTSQMQVLFDFEQVEIARGPQMTWQGAPNTAGTITLTRTKPTGEFSLDTRASFSSQDRKALDAVFNFPLVENLAGKIGVSWRDGGGGYMRNVTVPRGENAEDRLFLSASFLWQYSDALKVQYTFDRERDESDTPALLNLSPDNDLVCIASINEENCGARFGIKAPQTGTVRHTAQNFSNRRNYDGDYHTLRVDYDLGGYRLTSITGLRSNDESMDRDVDATQADFYSLSADQDYDQFSQEFRAFNQYTEQLAFTTGFYLLEMQYKLRQQEFFILNALGNAGLGAPRNPEDIRLLDSKTDSRYTSVFAHLEYEIDDQWNADIGTRVAFIDKEFKHNPLGLGLSTGNEPSPVNISRNRNWTEVSFSTGISYKVDEEAMIYSRFSRGVTPGGFNENAVSTESARAYGAETSRNFEIGMKSEWYDDKLRLNIVYYRTEHDNKREQFISPVAPGRLESVIDNVSTIEIDGWEIEFEAVPIDNLFIRGAYSHMDSDYVKYRIPDLDNPGEIRSFRGLGPPRAPPDSVFVSALYSMNLYGGVFRAYAGYRYYNDYQTNPLLAIADVKNHGYWDFSFDYVWQDWTFRLFSQNVRDKRYQQNAFRLTNADVSPLPAGAVNAQGLVTFSEYNQPRYTGFEVIFRPDLSGLFQ